jgi:hypothetical protein
MLETMGTRFNGMPATKPIKELFDNGSCTTRERTPLLDSWAQTLLHARSSLPDQRHLGDLRA